MKNLIFLFMCFVNMYAFTQEETKPEPAHVPVVEEKQEIVGEKNEKEAQFPGGPMELQKFFAQHLMYPQESIEKDEQGNVYVQFNVEVTGEISDIVVLRGVSENLDREARRIIRSMPKWIPAESEGQFIKSRVILPIKFRLK